MGAENFALHNCMASREKFLGAAIGKRVEIHTCESLMDTAENRFDHNIPHKLMRRCKSLANNSIT